MDMASQVMVDMPLCGFEATIKAEKEGGLVKIDITSDCDQVMKFAEALGDVKMKDVLHIRDNKIMEVAGNYLTPSCLVPCGIMNAARIEFGLISKRLAMKKGDLRIVFEK